MIPYISDEPSRARTSDELRASIPGWGADLDPKNRPAVPRERFAPETTGAHWKLPEQQDELVPRERSIEHGRLTPVFGTVAPLKGVSGIMRRYAYARHSEGKAAHWLILIAADRVDAIESHLVSFATLRPDNPFVETGLRSELTHHGLRSRFGKKRVDLSHAWIDPILIVGPWFLAGLVAYKAVKVLTKGK